MSLGPRRFHCRSSLFRAKNFLEQRLKTRLNLGIPPIESTAKSASKGKVRFRQLRVELQRFLRELLLFNYRLFARHHDSSHIGVGVGQAAIGQSIVGIELQRLLVITDRVGPAGFAVFAKLVASQQIEAMSLRVLGWFLRQSASRFAP